MQEQYKKWYSPTLSMDTELLIFGHTGRPVILFPTTKGSYHENRDFKMLESAKWFIEKGMIQVYCPSSVDAYSWYNKSIPPASRVKNHIWYDKFIHREILEPALQKSGHAKACVAGPSFGGFHALNFAFRHPDRVSHLLSMSGAFEVKSFVDNYYDENVYFNNPVDYMPGNNNPHLWQMSIVLGVGEHDICLDASRKMSGILNAKGIKHWLDIYRGEKHDWPLWRKMFPKYLSHMMH